MIAGALNANVQYSPSFVPLAPNIWNELTFCVQAPKPLAQWQYSLAFFSDDILWLAYAFCVIFYINLIYLFTGFEARPLEYVHCALFFFGSVLSVSMPLGRFLKTSMTSTRCFISFGLISCFLAISIYNASYYDVVMVPRYSNQLKTIQDVAVRAMCCSKGEFIF